MLSTIAAATTLVNRHAERAQLDRLLADARNGISAAVVLRGEAGVRKSALCDYVPMHAAGCHVVRAAGVESEMRAAFRSFR